MEEQCESTHVSPTAAGDLEVRCARPADHEGQHEAWVQKVFAVRWRDEPVSG